MARGSASAHKDDQEALSQGEPKSSKRRCVQSACVPCRKRKSKCDGGAPVCATCIAVYKTECFYDPESESRRSKQGFTSSTGAGSAGSAGTKRDASPTTSAPTSESALTAEFLINSLRRLPEEEVLTFISLVRREPQLDIPTLAETWRRTVTLTPNIPLQGQSLEDDLSVLLGKPAVTLTGQSRHFGHSAGLGLVPEDEDFGSGQPRKSSVHIERKGSTWTNVTNDLGFVENLFALYFTWSHPFYVLFSRECFYKDFNAGRNKYCSSLLVNAICAYACHLTDDPAGRTDPSNFRTAGDHFFAEAKRILFEDETPSLTTTQALCIMSMREPSTGRDTSGFNYIGRCIHMCVELGLHLNNSASPVLRLTPSEIEVRKVTFWGCFIIDTVYSLVTGRIAQLPRAAITLDKPIMDEAAGPPEANAEISRAQPGVVTTRMFLQEFATLSELVNDNNYMFFAPREPLNSHIIVGCYSKYKAWYQKLPVALGIEGVRQPEPHTLVLHMLYHTLIVHLFRPMLKVDFVGSDVQPREACIEAANKVSDIIRTYRKFYSFRVAHLAIPHILLTIGIVHLLYSRDNKISYANLVEGLQGLEDIHECHYFGARSFRILHTLASTWDLPWPDELRDSKLIPPSRSEKRQGTLSPPADPLFMAPNTFTTTGNRFGSNVSYSQMGLLARRESLSMFNNQASLQLATHPALTRPGSVPALQHQSPTVGRTPTRQYAPMSFHLSQSTTSVPPNVTAPANHSPAPDCTEPFFWTPMPDMPGPTIPRSKFQQARPMDSDTAIQPADTMDQGFKTSQAWHSPHGTGFARGTNPFPAPAHDSPQSVPYLHTAATAYASPAMPALYQRQAPLHALQSQHDAYDGASWYADQLS